jgi:predicted transcriptional regulator
MNSKKMYKPIALVFLMSCFGARAALQVRDIMSPCVIGIEGKGSAKQALALMEERKIHNLVVTDNGRATGVLSYQNAEQANPSALVNSLQENLPTLNASDDTDSVARLFEKTGKTLAAVNEGNKTVGVVTAYDIVTVPCVEKGFEKRQKGGLSQFKALKNKFNNSTLTVGDIMSPCVVAINELKTAQDALDLMETRAVHTLAVLNDQKFAIGMVRLVDAQKADPQTPVSELKKELLAVELHDTVGQAINALDSQKKGLAVVNDGGKTVGVVTLHDFISVPCVAKALDENKEGVGSPQESQALIEQEVLEPVQEQYKGEMVVERNTIRRPAYVVHQEQHCGGCYRSCRSCS